MSTKRVFVQSDHMKLYNGQELERGQVFELQNQLNDEKLIGWAYVKEVEKSQEIWDCKCGRQFVGTVTDPPAKAHNIRWRGQCSPAIEVDGVQLKSNAKPMRRGGGDPDADGPGWDLDTEANEAPPSDPYAGERTASGKEKPKRISLG